MWLVWVERCGLSLSGLWWQSATQTGWLLNSRDSFLPVLEVWGLGAGPGLMRALVWVVDCCPPPHVLAWQKENKRACWHHFHKDTDPMNEGSTLMAYLPPKGPSPNIKGWGFNTWIWAGPKHSVHYTRCNETQTSDFKDSMKTGSKMLFILMLITCRNDNLGDILDSIKTKLTSSFYCFKCSYQRI